MPTYSPTPHEARAFYKTRTSQRQPPGGFALRLGTFHGVLEIWGAGRNVW